MPGATFVASGMPRTSGGGNQPTRTRTLSTPSIRWFDATVDSSRRRSEETFVQPRPLSAATGEFEIHAPCFSAGALFTVAMAVHVLVSVFTR